MRCSPLCANNTVQRLCFAKESVSQDPQTLHPVGDIVLVYEHMGEKSMHTTVGSRDPS